MGRCCKENERVRILHDRLSWCLLRNSGPASDIYKTVTNVKKSESSYDSNNADVNNADVVGRASSTNMSTKFTFLNYYASLSGKETPKLNANVNFL